MKRATKKLKEDIPGHAAGCLGFRGDSTMVPEEDQEQAIARVVFFRVPATPPRESFTKEKKGYAGRDGATSLAALCNVASSISNTGC